MPFERLRRVGARLVLLVGLALVLAAIYGVHRTLHGIRWHEVQAALYGIGPQRWALALATVLSYGALAGYEFLTQRSRAELLAVHVMAVSAPRRPRGSRPP